MWCKGKLDGTFFRSLRLVRFVLSVACRRRCHSKTARVDFLTAVAVIFHTHRLCFARWEAERPSGSVEVGVLPDTTSSS